MSSKTRVSHSDVFRPPGDWHEEAPKESVLANGSAEIHGLKIGGQSNLNNFCSRIKSISYTRALLIAMLDSQRVSCLYICVCMCIHMDHMDGMYNQDNDRCAPQHINFLLGTSWLSPAELDMPHCDAQSVGRMNS